MKITKLPLTIRKKLNKLMFKCDDMQAYPFSKKALEMYNNQQGFPTYEELKLIEKKNLMENKNEKEILE